MWFICEENVKHPEESVFLLEKGQAYPIHVVNRIFQDYGIDKIKGIYCTEESLSN